MDSDNRSLSQEEKLSAYYDIAGKILDPEKTELDPTLQGILDADEATRPQLIHEYIQPLINYAVDHGTSTQRHPGNGMVEYPEDGSRMAAEKGLHTKPPGRFNVTTGPDNPSGYKVNIGFTYSQGMNGSPPDGLSFIAVKPGGKNLIFTQKPIAAINENDMRLVEKIITPKLATLPQPNS